LLSDVIEGVQNPSSSKYYTDSDAGPLQRLEDKLESFQSYSAAESGHHDVSADITELYRLASLVYLERASTNSSGPSTKVQGWLDKAFHILEKQSACQHPFLLFILGIELHNDAQRKLVLNLVHQTDVGSRTLAMENAYRMLQAVWLQDDLETGRVLDYRVKVKAVLSVSEILPSLA
jgi:hypothetical protein